MPSVLYQRRAEKGSDLVVFPSYRLVVATGDPAPLLSRLALEETTQ